LAVPLQLLDFRLHVSQSPAQFRHVRSRDRLQLFQCRDLSHAFGNELLKELDIATRRSGWLSRVQISMPGRCCAAA
jgi:hypothetical protein